MRRGAAALGARVVLAGFHALVVGGENDLCFCWVVDDDHFLLSEGNATSVAMELVPAVADSALISLLDELANLLPRYAFGGRPGRRGTGARWSL